MRYTVLTYIFGDYECVHEVKEKDPEADYVLVTDNPNLTSKTWRVVRDRLLDDKIVWEKCYEVRFHPFRYCSTEIVVRLDGSIGINKPLTPLLDEFERGEYDRCLMIHPRRNTMPDEYHVWVHHRDYPQEQAERCLGFMAWLGYDLGYKGLFQGCFEILRKCPLNLLVNDMTFDLLRYLAGDGHIQRVNQTILSFVINHFFSGSLKVMPISEKVVYGEMMTWYEHNSNKPQTQLCMIEPWMFNKPCEFVM